MGIAGGSHRMQALISANTKITSEKIIRDLKSSWWRVIVVTSRNSPQQRSLELLRINHRRWDGESATRTPTAGRSASKPRSPRGQRHSEIIFCTFPGADRMAMAVSLTLPEY